MRHHEPEYEPGEMCCWMCSTPGCEFYNPEASWNKEAEERARKAEEAMRQARADLCGALTLTLEAKQRKLAARKAKARATREANKLKRRESAVYTGKPQLILIKGGLAKEPSPA